MRLILLNFRILKAFSGLCTLHLFTQTKQELIKSVLLKIHAKELWQMQNTHTHTHTQRQKKRSRKKQRSHSILLHFRGEHVGSVLCKLSSCLSLQWVIVPFVLLFPQLFYWKLFTNDQLYREVNVHWVGMTDFHCSSCDSVRKRCQFSQVGTVGIGRSKMTVFSN